MRKSTRRKKAGLEGKVGSEAGTSSLERALKPFDIEVSKFEGEHGIDPAVLLRYHKNSDGTTVYLCQEETKEGSRFYILTASPKTSVWKEIVKKYRAQ